MSQPLSVFESVPTNQNSAMVELFDPPMCCPTGLCGPTLDQALLDLNEMILKLQSEGISVARYQLTTSPQAFLSNPDVMRLVRERQMEALPVIVVNGKVIKTGEYPTLAEIKTSLNRAQK